MNKTPSITELIEKHGAHYKYTLTGYHEGERVEIGTFSLAVLKKSRRELWKELMGREPPKVD